MGEPTQADEFPIPMPSVRRWAAPSRVMHEFNLDDLLPPDDTLRWACNLNSCDLWFDTAEERDAHEGRTGHSYNDPANDLPALTDGERFAWPKYVGRPPDVDFETAVAREAHRLMDAKWPIQESGETEHWNTAAEAEYAAQPKWRRMWWSAKRWWYSRGSTTEVAVCFLGLGYGLGLMTASVVVRWLS